MSEYDQYEDHRDDNYYEQPGGYLRPHRGGMILAFGILGLVFCQLFGIFAWIMGSGDIAAMNAGQMDPSGRDITNAGKICGIISVVLLMAGVGLMLLFVVFAALANH